MAFTVKSAGLSMAITETVLEYRPDELQLLQMEGMLSGRARWEATPEGDGTRLTTTFDYSLPGGPLGRIADALFVKRMNAKSLEEALHNFKVLVRGNRLLPLHRLSRRRSAGAFPRTSA